MDNFILSVIFALIAAIAWGLNSHLIKIGVQDESPMLALYIRALGAFPILTIITLIFYGIEGLTVYLDPTISSLVILTAILVVIGDGIFMYALKFYPVKNILPIAAIYPLITSIILILTGTETVTNIIIYGTILIIVGVGIVTRGSQQDSNGVITKIEIKMVIYPLIAGAFWGTSIFFVRLILQFDNTNSISLTALRTFLMGIIGLFFFLTSKSSRNNSKKRDKNAKRQSFRYLLYSGIVGWVFGAAIFFYAVDLIGAAIPTPISSTNPIIAVIIGKMTGLEDINKTQFIGIILSVLGTILIVLS